MGVRHHSAACAAAMRALLDGFAPTRVLVELPAELGDWFAWLGHPELVAPVALAARSEDALAFYPFADFSPELEAIRWATGRGVTLEAFDLPIGRRGEDAQAPDHASADAPLVPHLLARGSFADPEDLWDQLVETPAAAAEPEQIRRAALAYGWAMRADAARKLDPRDLLREAYMRERLQLAHEAGERCVAVIGAFHAAGLVDGVDPLPRVRLPKRRKKLPLVTTSLVPYRFDLLDSRSGYPAGVRDPAWQQRTFEALRSGAGLDPAIARTVLEVCRFLRAHGHPAGVPDAREAVRMARDLASLRGLGEPGRRELLEAIASALSQGEPLGRGRLLAKALGAVLVGDRRGVLPADAPRSGLAPHVEELLAALRLPGPAQSRRRPEVLRLDPLRSDLDRRRHVALYRLTAIGVDYADPAESELELLGRTWEIRWSPGTAASIEEASVLGVTLEQAAAGAIRARVAALQGNERWSASIHLEVLEVTAECGLAGLAEDGLRILMGPFLAEAGLAEIARALVLVDRIRHGHVPGLPPEGSPPRAAGAVPAFVMPEQVRRADLLEAAVRALEGLQGSDDADDAHALVEVVRLTQVEDTGAGRLGYVLATLADEGTPLMQGAAGAARVLLGADPAFGERLGSWVDAAHDRYGNQALADRLRGALIVAGPSFEAHPDLLDPLMDRVEAQSDDHFLRRLPALRDGFDVLSTADRGRLLDVVRERLGEVVPVDLTGDPRALARHAAADAAGHEAVARAGLAGPDPALVVQRVDAPRVRADIGIAALDRWRLILGREREQLDPAVQEHARAMDELYGHGRGEGSRGDLATDAEPEPPSIRDWSGSLDALFGPGVRDEVLGRAAARGRVDALLTLDPDRITPSVDLLQTVLSMRGALPPGELGRLRPLVTRIVDALVAELARSVRPALTGLAVPRPTRRRTGRLDLRRTLAANLRHVRIREGVTEIVPERLIFGTRGRRSIAWDVLLVVDTSGSMEPSVLHASMMAAILAGLPAVEVGFFTFSTSVLDLTGHVHDPLELLLAVKVGGGTDIGRALRYARERIRVPNRTLVVLVTDFDEGTSVSGLLAEVRALVETGATAIGLAALDEQARPRYHRAMAEQVAEAGMPVAALTPLELARWVGEQVRHG